MRFPATRVRGIFWKVKTMFFSFRHYSGLLLVLILAGSLAACTSTSTSSGASRATTTTEDDAAAGQQAAEDAQESTDVAESADAPSETTRAPVEPAVVQPLSAETDGASRDSVPETGAVDEVAVFPEQRYETEAEDTSDSEAAAEIERLRRELAATESELDRMRDEQSQTDYESGQAGATADGSGSDDAIAAEGRDDYSSDRSAARSADGADAMGGADGSDASGVSKVGNDQADLYGKPAEFSIYFGYDESSYEKRFEPVIVAHAEFLKANEDLKVEIQGNCDERGSREYNIALGQRRAEAVKRALELLGVQGSRIVTVSFGAEKPVAFGQDEESYRLNRRADIVY